MTDSISIPILEDRLERLRPGQTLRLGHADFVRLFGVNDAALGRLANFAKGHNCLTNWSRAGLSFEKNSPEQTSKTSK